MSKTVLEESQKRGHEQVVHFYYPQVGLKAIIGIHNTVLGPALGGCRMRIYTDESQALDDCMRLSEGMTYKSAVAGMDLGGGKAVIIADPHMVEGRRELFKKFGECLNNLNGRYITAEDMGTSVTDVMYMREATDYVTGIDPKEGGGGDPSPWTALGCFKGIQAVCERRYGSSDLKGRSVSIQGVGHVGMYLLEHLAGAGAKIYASDIDEEALQKAKTKYGAEIVPVEKIYDVKVDIYAPCAMGQTVNPDTLKRLQCDIIAGAANNQLSEPGVIKEIMDRKMIYCPDFVINAGGVVSVGAERNPGGWKEGWVREKVTRIYNTIHEVLADAEKRNMSTEVVSIERAKERIRIAEEKNRR